MPLQKKPLILGITVGVLFLSVVFNMITDNKGQSIPEPHTTPALPKSSAVISVGDKAHINTEIAVAVNDSAWDELNKASRARDTLGMANLVASGRIFIAEPDSKVLIIEGGFTSVKVRMMSGDNIGKSGWVISEAVSK